jgi:hypothetical protein
MNILKIKTFILSNFLNVELLELEAEMKVNRINNFAL